MGLLSSLFRRGARAVEEPVTRLPVNFTRELGPNAMPIAPPAPFRNSLRGGSQDLADAAYLGRSWRTEPTWNEKNGAVELFHATKDDITDFRPNTFFSTTPDYADEMFGNVPGQRVYRAKAEIRRPYDVKTDAEREAFQKADPALIERARAAGFDAIRMEDDLGGYEVIPLNKVSQDFPLFSLGGAAIGGGGLLSYTRRKNGPAPERGAVY